MSFQLDLFNPLCSECGRYEAEYDEFCDNCLSDLCYAESLLWEEKGVSDLSEIFTTREEYLKMLIPYKFIAKNERVVEQIEIELKNISDAIGVKISTAEEFVAMCRDGTINSRDVSDCYHLAKMFVETKVPTN